MNFRDANQLVHAVEDPCTPGYAGRVACGDWYETQDTRAPTYAIISKATIHRGLYVTGPPTCLRCVGNFS